MGLWYIVWVLRERAVDEALSHEETNKKHRNTLQVISFWQEHRQAVLILRWLDYRGIQSIFLFQGRWRRFTQASFALKVLGLSNRQVTASSTNSCPSF